jgi:hypothetical protein
LHNSSRTEEERRFWKSKKNSLTRGQCYNNYFFAILTNFPEKWRFYKKMLWIFCAKQKHCQRQETLPLANFFQQRYCKNYATDPQLFWTEIVTLSSTLEKNGSTIQCKIRQKS